MNRVGGHSQHRHALPEQLHHQHCTVSVFAVVKVSAHIGTVLEAFKDQALPLQHWLECTRCFDFHCHFIPTLDRVRRVDLTERALYKIHNNIYIHI